MSNNTHGPSTTETTPVPEVTQDATMDSYGRKAVFPSAIDYGLDGFDLLILSFALSGIIATFHLTDIEAGSLHMVTLLGAVLGSIVFGILADRFGRVRMLTYSVILFAVFTGLSTLATGYTDLAIYRFIAGIGIGGEFGIGMTLAAEAVPARMRARATSWVGLGFQFGVLAAALLFAPIMTAFGWRGLFVVGAFPAVVAVIIRKRLHESPKFLEKAANVDHGAPKVRGNSLRLLVGNKKAIRVTIALIVLTSVQNFGYFGIMSWLPRYLSTQFHLNLTNSSIWIAVTVVGMMTGIIVFGQLADRIGRRQAFWIFQIGAAVCVLAYSQITDPGILLAGGFIMGAFANGMLGGYGDLMAELYPTGARATAQNVLFNIGRSDPATLNRPSVLRRIAAALGPRIPAGTDRLVARSGRDTALATAISFHTGIPFALVDLPSGVVFGELHPWDRSVLLGYRSDPDENVALEVLAAAGVQPKLALSVLSSDHESAVTALTRRALFSFAELSTTNKESHHV